MESVQLCLKIFVIFWLVADHQQLDLTNLRAVFHVLVLVQPQALNVRLEFVEFVLVAVIDGQVISH